MTTFFPANLATCYDNLDWYPGTMIVVNYSMHLCLPSPLLLPPVSLFPAMPNPRSNTRKAIGKEIYNQLHFFLELLLFIANVFHICICMFKLYMLTAYVGVSVLTSLIACTFRVALIFCTKSMQTFIWLQEKGLFGGVMATVT